MIGFDEAIVRLGTIRRLHGHEVIALADAAGRTLAVPLLARNDAPRAAVSTMDGYAVADATTSPGLLMRVVGHSLPGSGYGGVVRAGEAVRIFTGAPMPQGTDRCIIQEQAIRDGDAVRFSEGYGPGWHVRQQASDFASGDLLLEAGTRLTPRAMVVAAAADVAEVVVAPKPRIAIISTGDELAPPGSAHLQPHAIPDSISLGVAAMAQAAGAAVVHHASGLDDLPALEAAAGKALAAADLVIVTGGASVGDKDFAKQMFLPHGLELIFSKLAIKPGKPVWLGRADDGRLVLGLPGNPTSAMVTARLFLLPLLARLEGDQRGSVLRWSSLPLAAALPATDERETFIRARHDGSGLVPLGNQDSGLQSALLCADWLIRCPPGQPALQTGTLVQALVF